VPRNVPAMTKAYWNLYDLTLARIAEEKPQSFEVLKELLDAFQPPSSGDAFFPGGADESLADALHTAGWEVAYGEGDYVWVGKSRIGVVISYIEGDVYLGDKTLPRA
jgi:hypothetical protein